VLERLKDLAQRENVEVEETALRLLAREAGGSMRDAERMLETAIATGASGKVTEAEVAASLGVASRTTVLKLADAILEKNAASALSLVRELASRGANLESLGRDLLETLRNLAVAKLPATDSQSPLDDIPDHEVAELKRLAARASARDIMRLFRLMADSQEQIIKSPYPDLLLEMAVVRMASLAAVIDADELIRAIGAGNAPPSAGKPPSGKPPGESGGARGSSSSSKEASGESSSGATRLRVEGEVKADAPLRVSSETHPQDDAVAELPELRNFIRGRRAALAGFMEQGAGLALEGSILTVTARNDIYIRYLTDNRAVIAELASEHLGRPIRVELSNAGVAAPRSKSGNPPVASITPARETAPTPQAVSKVYKPIERSIESIREAAPAPAAPRRVATPEERNAVLTDPAMRRVFDTLDARLVELRMPTHPAADAAKESDDANLNEAAAAGEPAARER
jgi:DNA polymerase-3 subunit gamma/tau